MPRRLPRTLPRPADTQPPDNARLRLGVRTRERVIEAAAGLVLQGSVSAMSISDLVEVAGVPASSIYWHFGSKEGLVAAVAAAAVERWLALLPDPDSLPATGEKRVAAGIAGVTDALVRDARAVTLVTKVGVELGEGKQAGLEIVRRARADVIRYGVHLFAPAFKGLPVEHARAAAERMSVLLMATADGIAVNAAIHGKVGVAPDDYRILGDLALLLYHSETGSAMRGRKPSSRRSNS